MGILAAAAPLIGEIGAGVSAVGSIFGGIAQGESAAYQSQIAANNARVAQQNAVYAEEAGSAKVQQAGLRAAEQGGMIKASMAANNVDTNTGSARDVQSGQREVSALDEYTIANNAELQAYGYRTQATGFQAQSELEKSQSVADPIGGLLGGVGSFFSNAKSFGGSFPNPWTGAAAASSSASGGIGSDYVAAGG